MTAQAKARRKRIRDIVAEVGPWGLAEDLGLADVLGQREPDQFLLVEQNNGSAAHSQSHWFSLNPSLEAASKYHLGQEYREDWEALFAIDLDTGTKYLPYEHITWATESGVEVATDVVSRESIIEALRDAHRRDSAADAVEYVSILVGWSAEDEVTCEECGAVLPDDEVGDGPRPEHEESCSLHELEDE